jgi:hypothetical protein
MGYAKFSVQFSLQILYTRRQEPSVLCLYEGHSIVIKKKMTRRKIGQKGHVTHTVEVKNAYRI